MAKDDILDLLKGVLLAISLACFTMFLYLFEYYHSIDPRLPIPASGYVIPSNNHGSYVFLNEQQDFLLNIFMWVSPLLFGIAVTIDRIQKRVKTGNQDNGKATTK